MAPIVVAGKTLGEVHRNYNYAVKSTRDSHIERIDYNDEDLHNLFKIDQAIRNKNIDYILESLKSKDLLYCSRAIKQSTWIINDPQYAHIINADYLFTKLFPEMLTKARNKFLLHIRIHLKDKKRAQDFFISLKKIDIKIALKWLPYCCEEFITENLKIYIDDLSFSVLMRLTEISLNFLDIYCMTQSQSWKHLSMNYAAKICMRYAKRDILKYLDILDRIPEHMLPTLSPKITKLIMNKYPERIFDNFDRYKRVVDIKTIAKSIKQTEIKSFLIERIISGKDNQLFGSNIKHIIMRLPEQERFEFVQKHFIDKEDKGYNDIKTVSARLDNIYRWYTYASFEKAFIDLRQLIRLESNVDERYAIICVMLDCAGNNPQNIHDLLEYYKTHHINEAFKFKNKFINKLLDKTCPCDFEEKTWKILQDIFTSMEVYAESDNNVQSCIRWIILYKITHNQEIPEIVTSKFNFCTFKKEQGKLKDCHKEKVFTYLLGLAREQLYKCKQENYRDVQVTLIWTNNMLNLLCDWHQDLINYPDVIEIIKALSRVPKERRTSAIFNQIYNKNKSWRKYLINESILLSPSEATFMNALKHNPKLLEQSREEIRDICCDDKISLINFLRKLRIYNTHLAHEFEEIYFHNLERSSRLKSSVLALCLILPPQKLSSLVTKFVPEEKKINWNQIDEKKLNLQKLLAGNMHKARPQPAIDLIFAYAQGDYLQYALGSLTSVLNSIPSVELQKEILHRIDTPASLQKHIIRAAFMKCHLDELAVMLSNIWNKTKNRTIRATLFRLTFNLICKETEQEKIKRLWSIINDFIETLTVEENKIIFVTFSNLNKVPVQVRPDFCMKGYTFIKKLPERSNCKNILLKIIFCTIDIMELMDPDFMIEILMDSYEINIFQKHCRYIDVISAFILSTRDEKSQIYRYDHVLVPLFHDIEGIWKLEKDNLRKINTVNLLNTLIRDVDNIVIRKNMLMPIKLFKLILSKLKELPLEENYELITSRRLALEFIVVLEQCLNCYITAVKTFSKICLINLKEDIQTYGTSIVIAYGAALNEVLDNFHVCDANMRLELCEAILNETETKEGYLLVLRIIPQHGNLDVNKQMQILKKISSYPDNEVKILLSVFKNDLNFLV